MPGEIFFRRLFLVLLFANIATAIIGSELFWFFLIYYFILYITIKGDKDIFFFLKNSIGIPVVIIFCILNIPHFLNFAQQHPGPFELRMLFMPIFVLVTAAAAYRAALFYDIQARDLFLPMAAGIVAGIAAYPLVQSSGFTSDFAFSSARSSGLFIYNTNIADDVYIFLILISFLTVSVLSYVNIKSLVYRAAITVILLTILFYSSFFLVQGQSRGAWGAVVVSLGVVSIAGWTSRRRFVPSIAAIAVVGLVLLLTLGTLVQRATKPEAISIAPARIHVVQTAERIAVAQRTVTEPSSKVWPSFSAFEPAPASASNSLQRRLDLWRDAMHLIAKRPLTGLFGRDEELIRAEALYPEVTTAHPHFHNLYIDISVRFGVLLAAYSVFAILFLPGWSILSMIKKDSLRDDIFLSGTFYIVIFYFVYLFTENMVDVNYYQKEVFSIIVAFSSLAGIALGILDGEERSRYGR